MLCGAATGGLGSPEPPPCSVGFVFPFILCPGGFGGASHGVAPSPNAQRGGPGVAFGPFAHFGAVFFPPGQPQKEAQRLAAPKFLLPPSLPLRPCRG